jgi:hypothetical protein
MALAHARRIKNALKDVNMKKKNAVKNIGNTKKNIKNVGKGKKSVKNIAGNSELISTLCRKRTYNNVVLFLHAIKYWTDLQT